MSRRDPDFQSFDARELRHVLAAFPFRRRVASVHLHHTWRPDHGDYRGLKTIQSMWRYHTRELEWTDIAQHLTIAPDGTLWTGRDWNRRPASAKGFNGNEDLGPFMIEMIGDFDVGRDRLEGKQRAAVVETLAQLHEFFGLKDDTLTFHNTMSGKTCPGSAVDRRELLKEVKAARAKLGSDASAARGPRPFSDRALAVQRVVASLVDGDGASARGADPADAELPESGALPWYAGNGGNGSRSATGARGGFELTPEVLADLSPHVVNLTDGRLSTGGAMTSEPGQVRAIFEDHLTRELEAAREAKRPLRVVFYAHGGLVNEKAGLGTAYKHLEWWRANGVYPISFVWETGLFETIGALIAGRREGARGRFRDRLIEAAVRRLGGPKVWSGMKRSAARAVDPEGGARLAAELLVEFLQRNKDDEIELHAVGHSAGAIFHSQFLPAALDAGVKAFDSTHFFAPAITVEDFRHRLAPLAGKEIGPVTLYTMKKAFEEADEVIKIYDDSLLYLIHRALEPERPTPILGLEVSLRDDAGMRALFALNGTAPTSGEVVFSTTATTTGRSASTATTHGGFDDDAPTMNSVVRRVLGVGDEAEIVEIDPFLEEWESRGGSRGFDDDLDELDEELAAFAIPDGNGNGHATAWSPAPAANGGRPAAASGRRRALCVGIDDYPTSPLSGCVADARLWAETLTGLGFETPETLFDGQATRSAVLGALERMVADSRAGDVLVFQFAGHGTQLPDVDGDETDDAKDEALCTIDWEDGRALIDDDLAGVFATLPDGVNLTAFMDCCHSGTNTRVAGARAASTHPDPTARRRHVVATREIRERHREFRRRLGAARGAGDGGRGPDDMREVSFAACQPWELAWESQGHGEFTVHATSLLRGNGSVTHEEFERRVRQAFGASPRQKPLLDCARAARSRVLLQPLTGAAAATTASAAVAGVTTAGVPPGLAGRGDVAELLRAIAEMVD